MTKLIEKKLVARKFCRIHVLQSKSLAIEIRPVQDFTVASTLNLLNKRSCHAQVKHMEKFSIFDHSLLHFSKSFTHQRKGRVSFAITMQEKLQNSVTQMHQFPTE